MNEAYLANYHDLSVARQVFEKVSIKIAIS